MHGSLCDDASQDEISSSQYLVTSTNVWRSGIADWMVILRFILLIILKFVWKLCDQLSAADIHSKRTLILESKHLRFWGTSVFFPPMEDCHFHITKFIHVFSWFLLNRQTSKFLLVILSEWDTHHLEKNAAVLAEAVRKGIEDADSEVRATSRK